MSTPTLSCSKPAIPHLSTPRAILQGCHGVILSNRSCFGRLSLCLLFPSNLTAKRAILCLACANPLAAHDEALTSGDKAPVLGWERDSFSCIGTPFDGQLYLLRNERGTEQCSPCLLPLHAVSLEAWGWPAGLSTRLRLGGLSHPGTLS